MAFIHEELSEQFYAWEKRGRGWKTYSEPVRPEPPFRPFRGHYLKPAPAIDNGRRPTLLSGLVKNLSDLLRGPQPEEEAPEVEEEPEPQEFAHSDIVEIRTALPPKLNITREACEEFLANLSNCRNPIAFEILGTPQEISLQFACERGDLSTTKRQLEAHFPEGTFVEAEQTLETAWYESPHDEALVAEFGLGREFMFQLRADKADPFVGIVGALSHLQAGEVALFQVLFEPVRENWQESIQFSTCRADGKPFFLNEPELAAAAKAKVTMPLYAAVVRIGVLSGSFERTLAIARDLAGSLTVFADPLGNELIPLKNDEYPYEAHIEDMLARNSRRAGMILTSEELVGFVHLPSASVRSASLLRETAKTKAAPAVAHNAGILLGLNQHAGKTVEVRLSPEQRVKHMHVMGASGTGKSTLLFNLIRQDIESGQGVALIDPHGDLIDRVLGIIPEKRLSDVILVDPSDEEYSVGFNILSAHSDLEKILLSSDLVGIFERLSTSWGDQMGSVLRNAILAFLESRSGGTLADLRRFLIEPGYRTDFLKTVDDPDIVYYWQKAFPQLGGNKSIGSVLTRLETFLAPKPIRYMVSQKANRLDFSSIMDTGKIFLARLSRGEMGEENSFLLGSVLVAKFQQAAMARQRQEQAARRDFWLYLDEFHNFITPSMAEILTGARKYRLGLVLAHQELNQLQGDRKVSSAVLSSPYTRVIFRVGDGDAKNLESGLSFFEAKDLQNLEIGQAVCRVEKAGGDFNLSVLFPPYDEAEAKVRREEAKSTSRKRYATSRKEIEAALREKPAVEAAPVRETQPSAPETPVAEKPAPIPPAVPPPPSSLPPAPAIPPPIILSEEAKEALQKSAELDNEPATEKPSTGERSLGRGGEQHKAIQSRIQAAAEKLGFRATIEYPVLDGAGSVDLFLERPGLTIACEISVTTTIDHEVGNVLKCLKAGVKSVAVIALSEVRLEKIRKGVLASVGEEMAKLVVYFDAQKFPEYLESLVPSVNVPPDIPKKRKGRTIKRTVSTASEADRELKESEYHRAIAEALRKKKK